MGTLPILALIAIPLTAEPSLLFIDPQPVAIDGYTGDAMEPFVTRDGRYLLFNNRPESPNTDLYYAEYVDPLRWTFRGEVRGVNTLSLEGVASLDRSNNFYFVSTRNYEQTLSTAYRARFNAGTVDNVELVPGISVQIFGRLNFDVDISQDGGTLYFVDSQFTAEGPIAADLRHARRLGDGFVRLDETILAATNTIDLEYAPSISSDGLLLLFTRLRRETFDAGIYASLRKRNDLPFSPGVRLAALSGFVEAACFTTDETAIYFHRLDGDRYNLYRASQP